MPYYPGSLVRPAAPRLLQALIPRAIGGSQQLGGPQVDLPRDSSPPSDVGLGGLDYGDGSLPPALGPAQPSPATYAPARPVFAVGPQFSNSFAPDWRDNASRSGGNSGGFSSGNDVLDYLGHAASAYTPLGRALNSIYHFFDGTLGQHGPAPSTAPLLQQLGRDAFGPSPSSSANTGLADWGANLTQGVGSSGGDFSSGNDVLDYIGHAASAYTPLGRALNSIYHLFNGTLGQHGPAPSTAPLLAQLARDAFGGPNFSDTSAGDWDANARGSSTPQFSDTPAGDWDANARRSGPAASVRGAPPPALFGGGRYGESTSGRMSTLLPGGFGDFGFASGGGGLLSHIIMGLSH